MKYTILFLLLAGFLPISAVAAAKADQPSLQNLINAHVIVVSSTGDPLRPIVTQTGSKYHVKLTEWEGSGSEAEQTKMRERQYREYVANIISQIGDKEVLFFIHGGMNTADGAVERAAYLLDGPQSSQIPSKYYPIFICWDSPFAGTFWENVRWIRAGKTEEYSQAAHQMGRGYAFLTTPFRIVAEVGRAASRVPLQVAQFCYTGVYSVSPDGYTEHQVMEAELKELHEAKREKLKDNITVDHNPADIRTGPQKIGGGASQILTIPLKVATEPIIDSVGSPAWDDMLRRTDTMFEATLKSSVEAQANLKYRAEGALAIFFDRWRKKHKSNKITLVGHSMGAIIANRIVENYPELTYKNIVFMAAACRVCDFQQSILPYLFKHRKDPMSQRPMFYNLSLHPQCETSEIWYINRFPLDIPVRGSLLVWIDNIFGDPQSEERRMFGIFQTAMIACHTIRSEVRSQIVFKSFGLGVPPKKEDPHLGSPNNWYPQRHGDFSESPFWDETFWKPRPGAS